MSKSIRIKDYEENLVKEICIKLNKILVNNNKAPMRDSEFIHLILRMALENVKIDKEGDIYIDI